MQDENNAQQTGWGGARKGAGRKKSTAKSIALRIPDDVAEILESVEGSKSAYIVAAIRAYAQSQTTNEPSSED